MHKNVANCYPKVEHNALEIMPNTEVWVDLSTGRLAYYFDVKLLMISESKALQFDR
jgi:hypothetical protein